MKKILTILVLISFFASYSCNENVLGIEKNVKVIPIDGNSTNNGEDTTIVPVKTVFRADSIYFSYFELVTWDKAQQRYYSKWTPAMGIYFAVIDTASPAKLTLSFSATRSIDKDTIPKLRKEHILAYEIKTDSLIIQHIFKSNRNTAHYSSKLVEQILSNMMVRTVNGNYDFTLELKQLKKQDNHLVLAGSFNIKVPLIMMRQYLFFFNGEFKIFFPTD